MKWLFDYLRSSVGRKQTMGLAGFLLIGFLGLHGLGNLQLLNPDAASAQSAYNAYTKFLTGMKPFIWFAEASLVAIFAGHLVIGIMLKLENLSAAGRSRYAVKARFADAGLPSRTMIFSGVAILAFLGIHLACFKFGHYYLYRTADGQIIRDMWLTTVETFANPVIVMLYVLSLALLGIHLVHAIPSLFRTFGLASAKWTPMLNFFGRLVALGVAGLFILTALGTFVLAQNDTTKAVMLKARSVQAELEAVK